MYSNGGRGSRHGSPRGRGLSYRPLTPQVHPQMHPPPPQMHQQMYPPPPQMCPPPPQIYPPPPQMYPPPPHMFPPPTHMYPPPPQMYPPPPQMHPPPLQMHQQMHTPPPQMRPPKHQQRQPGAHKNAGHQQQQQRCARAVHRCKLYDPQSGVSIVAMDYDPFNNRLALARTVREPDAATGSSAQHVLEVWSCEYYQRNLHVNKPPYSIPAPVKQSTLPCDSASIESLRWVRGDLVVCSIDGVLAQYSTLSGKIKYREQLCPCPIWCSSWHADDQVLACGLDNSRVLLVDINLASKPQITATYSLPFNRRLLCLTWHPSQKGQLAVGSIDSIHIIHDVYNKASPVQRISVDRESKLSHTVVWSLTYVGDGSYLCSGDSRGKTSFWNTSDGTLLASHQMHDADVLAVATDSNGLVYSTGVDPKIQIFRAQMDETNVEKCVNWLPFAARQKIHTHDVRCLLTVGGDTPDALPALYSAGVDGNLVLSLPPPVHRSFHYWPYVMTDQVDYAYVIAKGLVVFSYGDSLDVWRCGKSEQKVNDVNGSRLAMTEYPSKLLSMKTKKGARILSVAISDDGGLLAYSTPLGTRLFRVQVEEDDASPAVTRIECTTHSQLPVAGALSITINGQHTYTLLLVNAEDGLSMHMAHVSAGTCELKPIQVPWPTGVVTKGETAVRRVISNGVNSLFITSNYRVYLLHGGKITRVTDCPNGVPVVACWIDPGKFAVLWHDRVLTVHQITTAGNETRIIKLVSQCISMAPYGFGDDSAMPTIMQFLDGELLIAGKDRLTFIRINSLMAFHQSPPAMTPAVLDFVKSTDTFGNVCAAWLMARNDDSCGNDGRIISQSGETITRSVNDVCVVELNEDDINSKLPAALKQKVFGLS